MALIRGLVLDGRFDEARELVDAAMARCTAGGELFAIPELLRLKAGIVGQIIDNNPEVEAILNQAAALARTQGARAWELRTSIDLAETLAARREICWPRCATIYPSGARVTILIAPPTSCCHCAFDSARTVNTLPCSAALASRRLVTGPTESGTRLAGRVADLTGGSPLGVVTSGA
jgi:hypothetical protein